MFVLASYPNKRPQSPLFFIQSKGYQSGRPLQHAIANCFAVYSDDTTLFQKVFALWVTGKFREKVQDSVIPFLRKGDAEKVMRNVDKITVQVAEAVQKTEEIIVLHEQKIKKYRELQKSLLRHKAGL